MKKLLVMLLALWSYNASGQECLETEPLVMTNKFILVVDRSGSMSGEAIRQAQIALKSFIDDMKPADEAALIVFDDQIDVWSTGNRDKLKLKELVDRLTPRGGTRLYDALGRASMLAHQTQSQRIIIFMTDGHDWGSHLKIENLNSINPSEGIYVYGIGLGDVNKDALREIARQTGGDFIYTPTGAELKNIYRTVLANYYQTTGARLQTTAQLIIRSLPSNQKVILNGRTLEKTTPVMIDQLAAGRYKLEVGFGRGTWKCEFDLKGGIKGFVNARESDLGRDLVIASDVKFAMVFIDGNFVGYTSAYPLIEKTVKTGWFKKGKVVDYSRQLIVKNVPQGTHTIRLVGFPEMEGFFDPIQFDFTVKNKNIAIAANFTQRTGGFEEIDQSLKPRKSNDPFESEDPFSELE